MGFSIGGLLKAVFTTATSVFKAVSGVEKPTLEMILPKAAGSLFESIMEASKYRDLTSKAKIDSWLGTLDTSFGSESGSLDVINTMPAAVEEELTDHLIGAARVVLYNKHKVPGFYEEPAA